LGTGESLPTVRALAAELGTSPATVNSAYRTLRQRGLVVAAGRRGTKVAPRPALRAPLRPPASTRPEPGLRDLTIGLANPALLPPLAPALARIDLEAKLQLAELDVADPELLELAARAFDGDGVCSDALTVVAGALDGIERVLQAHLRPGDRVVIEDPAYPPIRDILLALGLTAIPVTVDDRGLEPEQLQAALAGGVEAVVTVPRAQNPRGSALDEHRAAELQALLQRWPDVLLVEDDHAAIISGAPYHSLVAPNWPRWAVVRTMSKILHPDLRVALMAGDETTVARVEGRQALGPRWVSHILQATAAELLRDPEFPAIADRAAEHYRAQREALIVSLSQHGITAFGRSGLNVWVPVREEAVTVRALLAHGWLVLAGERFRIATPPAIRITIATLEPGDAPQIADIVASVEHSGRQRRDY
jgi:DNA-binding transcriptional MocR family regulator